MYKHFASNAINHTKIFTIRFIGNLYGRLLIDDGYSNN